MSNSSLVNYTKISPNKNSPRNNSIKKITIHHMAGNLTVEACGNIFADASRQGSSNYGIGSDGRIGLYVDEKDRAWTSSNAENDHQAITIEVANCGGAPDWPISDKAYASLINLCTDICKRNGIKKLNYTGDKTGNLTRHNMFAATNCPGPYLQAKFPAIAAEVNKRLSATGAQGYVDGTNISRGANQLICYKNKKSTGTNQYGYEVAFNKYNIALADPVKGEGNMSIPSGGFVLSGHGTAGTWLLKNIRAGNRAFISSDGKVSVQTKQYRAVDAVNGARKTNYLCIYNKGTSTGTNQYGYEAMVQNGVVISVAGRGNGNNKIPKGGFVVSGHGDSGTWVSKYLKKGVKVSVAGDVVIAG